MHLGSHFHIPTVDEAIGYVHPRRLESEALEVHSDK